MRGFYNNLLCVKSLMTVVLTIALVVLAFVYPDDYVETMQNAVTMVVTFYFAHQTMDRKEVKSWESSGEESTSQNTMD